MSDDVDDHEPDDRGDHGNDDDLDVPAWVSGSGRDATEAEAARAALRSKRRVALAERRRHRRRVWAAFAVVAVLVLPFVVFTGWLWYEISPPGGAGQRVSLDVQQGWSTARIADELQGRGVIGSSLAFQIYARVHGGGPFQAGIYDLRTNLGASAAMGALKRGASERRVVLPPGLTLEQIAAKVGQVRHLTAAKFLAAAESGAVRSKYEPPGVSSLEGLTYPDTYFVSEHDTETAVLRRLVARFDQQADAAGLGAPSPTGLSAYQTVIAASLIQTEAGVDEDRPLIAAVIDNRLRDGTMLQIDSTLCFVKSGCTQPLTNADKQLASPYNTYLVKGLPPTPIATVSTKSLKAALAPANVPYRFYVIADRSGKHAFAVTYEEHLKNVAAARAKGLL